MPIGLGSGGTGSPCSARAQFPVIEADPSDLDVDGGGATEPLNGLRSDADDRKVLDRLELTAVVRADLELVTQTGRSDQKVEIANRPRTARLAR